MTTFRKCICEYVWIDAFGSMRSKIKVSNFKINDNGIPDIVVDEWNFDGSSTGQAVGTNSDILIRPIAVFKNPFTTYMPEFSFLVLCDCYNKDGTPHETNKRFKCIETFEKCKDEEPLFGIEQEYILFGRNNLPLDWKEHLEPGKGAQGPYYCSVGGDRCFGRKIAEKHLQLCLEAGIEICGINAEVMASQWEYQIGPLPPLEVSDHLWMSRYILMRVTEDFGCYASFHPKPYKGDWNGSGGHTNFSTKKMREEGGINIIIKACEKLKENHNEHMQVYGKYNDERLTGLHETSSINDFSWGFSDRNKSIRIPLNVVKNARGYLEDRRPASNLDPYLVTEKLMLTTSTDTINPTNPIASNS